MSLVDRAEMRAERFEDYSGKRANEAHRTREYVERIADGIPLGQPILIGHHSERHARRDAKRIEDGMRKAVSLWETSTYWTERAKGAISAAKYKELPAVRARRIKKLEAEQRKYVRANTECRNLLKFWHGETSVTNRATGEKRLVEITEENRNLLYQILGRMSSTGVSVRGKDGQNWYSAWDCLRPDEERYQNCPDKTVADLQESAVRLQAAQIDKNNRWLAHYNNRLAYERAMLDEQGASQLLAPKAKPKQLPLLNYQQETFQKPNIYYKDQSTTIKQIEMTAAEYKSCYSTGTCTIDGTHRVRLAMMRLEGDSFPQSYAVFLTDSKAHPKPEAKPSPAEPLTNGQIDELLTEMDAAVAQKAEAVAEPVAWTAPAVKSETVAELKPMATPAPVVNSFEAMKRSLKAGIQTVSAPQLFPTPPAIAERMADLLEVEDGMCVLEPSAGTGNLCAAVHARVDTEVLAYEVNGELCRHIERRFPSYKTTVRQQDFLTVTEFQGCYPRVIMNPPFENGVDIKHIMHALTFLAEGGRLVGLCANGPRQREALKPLSCYWDDLPAGSFAAQGTNVNVALLVIEKSA